MPIKDGEHGRDALLIVALLQLAASVVIPVLFFFKLGMAKLGVLDKYCELNQQGVIDHAKLANVQNGRFAADWAEIPYYLVEQYDGLNTLVCGASILCIVTSISLFAIWWGTGGDKGDCAKKLEKEVETGKLKRGRS